MTRIEKTPAALAKFASAIYAKCKSSEVTMVQVKEFCNESGIYLPAIMNDCRVKPRGKVSLDIMKEKFFPELGYKGAKKASVSKKQECKVIDEPVKAVKEEQDDSIKYAVYVPKVDESFVEEGSTNYEFVEKVVSRNLFFPVYLYGLAGIGKTSTVEHACAKLGRPFFRVQISQFTTEEDLIGGYRLVDGNTVWQDGAVLSAYRSGGILVLDEVDTNPNLLCLQGVLEGKPLFIKQTGELVEAKKGFNVFATGNSKGDGNSYRFVGTEVLNEAFLDRFAAILKQDFATTGAERKILKAHMNKVGLSIPANDVNELLKFVGQTRRGNTEEYISTRRVKHIADAYGIVGDMGEAIKIGISRFSEETKEAFGMLWKAIHVQSQASNEHVGGVDLSKSNGTVEV